MEKISSKDNPRVKRLQKLLDDKKTRREEGFFVTEGARLSMDAHLSGVKIHEVYFTGQAREKYARECEALFSSDIRQIELDEGICAKISQTQTPQGVFCLCEALDNDKDAVTILQGGHYLVLESIQDPGNLGTVIRTAEAFGIDGLFLSADCPDLFSPKLLRATMGSVFRLPVRRAENIVELIGDLRAAKVPVYAAALCEHAVSVTTLDLRAGCAVIVGNEGAGVKPETIAACDQAVIIEMKGRAQSLNAAVAASVILWEMNRT